MARAYRWCAFCVIAFYLGFSAAAQGQKDVPNQEHVIDQVRLLYYTPTTAGLRSFTCGIKVDWNEIFQRSSSGKTVDANDPRLLYMNNVKIMFTGYLDGKSDVEWTPPSGDYPAGTAAFWRMRDGMTKMLTGYTKMWSVFLNGTFLPAMQDQYHLTKIADGYDIFLSQGGTSVDEKFDPSYVLKEYHVKTPSVNLDLHTTFTKSSDGMLFSAYDGEYSAAVTDASAIPTHIAMQATYQTVGGYRILNTMQMNIMNAGQFDFTFTNCKVNEDATAVNPSVPTKAK